MKHILKLALDALNGVLDAKEGLAAQFWSCSGGVYEAVQCKAAITAITQALNQPQYLDITPHLNVGNSAFEDWFQAQPFATQSGIKQICRDSYAAGMGDPLVESVKQPVASIYVATDGIREFDDWRCDLPTGRTELYAAPVAQPTPQQEPRFEWTVFNGAGAAVIENITKASALEYLSEERIARGWNAVGCEVIDTVEKLNQAQPVAQPAPQQAQPASQTDPDWLRIPCDCHVQCVAWRVSFNDGKDWTIWETDPQMHPKQAIVQPLYTHSTCVEAQPVAQPVSFEHEPQNEPHVSLASQQPAEPLTDEQIESIGMEHIGTCFTNEKAFARAIEAAHGIKAKDKP